MNDWLAASQTKNTQAPSLTSFTSLKPWCLLSVIYAFLLVKKAKAHTFSVQKQRSTSQLRRGSIAIRVPNMVGELLIGPPGDHSPQLATYTTWFKMSNGPFLASRSKCAWVRGEAVPKNIQQARINWQVLVNHHADRQAFQFGFEMRKSFYSTTPYPIEQCFRCRNRPSIWRPLFRHFSFDQRQAEFCQKNDSFLRNEDEVLLAPDLRAEPWTCCRGYSSSDWTVHQQLRYLGWWFHISMQRTFPARLASSLAGIVSFRMLFVCHFVFNGCSDPWVQAYAQQQAPTGLRTSPV